MSTGINYATTCYFSIGKSYLSIYITTLVPWMMSNNGKSKGNYLSLLQLYSER